MDGMNVYVNDFVNNAELLANRYKDQIKQWEVWNEPDAWSNPDYRNDPQHAGITYILPRVYANLFAQTYRRLNGGGNSLLDDYGIALASGGLFAHDIGGSFSTSMPYMREVYNETATWDAFQADMGRRYAWDDFGYHFYINQGNPLSAGTLASYIDAVRSTKASNNDPADLVITEFGWQSDVGTNTEAFQRDNMATAYEIISRRKPT
jgi:hypothetical protein